MGQIQNEEQVDHGGRWFVMKKKSYMHELTIFSFENGTGIAYIHLYMPVHFSKENRVTCNNHLGLRNNYKIIKKKQ